MSRLFVGERSHANGRLAPLIEIADDLGPNLQSRSIVHSGVARFS
jgi:hypothetical protein